ncbi:MAG: hypothetical protein AB1508_18955 [Pseudomonadota bacterium]
MDIGHDLVGSVMLPVTSADGTIDADRPVDAGTVLWSIHPGDTIRTAETASAAATGAWRPGRNSNAYPRINGHAFFLKLQSAEQYKPWEIEEVQVRFAEAGLQRAQASPTDTQQVGRLTWAVLAGTTNDEAAEATVAASGTWIPGTNLRSYPRAIGASFFIRVSGADTYEPWELETITARFVDAGRQRL